MAASRDPDLLAAIGEAVEKYPLDDEGDGEWDSWDAEGELTEAAAAADAPKPGSAPGESQSQTAEGSEPGTTPEAKPVQETDVPTEFWGVDLSDIPAERRAAILALAEQQESTIHKLQQRLSEQKQPEPAPPVEEPVLTDDDILVAIGVDPEDYSVSESARAALIRMAKATMALEDKVESLATKDTTREVETFWNSELDRLEAENGKLPFDRIQVLQYAVEEGLTDPVGVYFRLSAPVKREVEHAAAEARREALKRESTGGVRPRTGGGEPIPVTKGMSMREAVEKAARSAEKTTKLRWRDAVKQRVTPPSA